MQVSPLSSKISKSSIQIVQLTSDWLKIALVFVGLSIGGGGELDKVFSSLLL